jgi:hypothetical protein
MTSGLKWLVFQLSTLDGSGAILFEKLSREVIWELICWQVTDVVRHLKTWRLLKTLLHLILTFSKCASHEILGHLFPRFATVDTCFFYVHLNQTQNTATPSLWTVLIDLRCLNIANKAFCDVIVSPNTTSLLSCPLGSFLYIKNKSVSFFRCVRTSVIMVQLSKGFATFLTTLIVMWWSRKAVRYLFLGLQNILPLFYKRCNGHLEAYPFVH